MSKKNDTSCISKDFVKTMYLKSESTRGKGDATHNEFVCHVSKLLNNLSAKQETYLSLLLKPLLIF